MEKLLQAPLTTALTQFCSFFDAINDLGHEKKIYNGAREVDARGLDADANSTQNATLQNTLNEKQLPGTSNIEKTHTDTLPSHPNHSQSTHRGYVRIAAGDLHAEARLARVPAHEGKLTAVPCHKLVRHGHLAHRHVRPELHAEATEPPANST